MYVAPRCADNQPGATRNMAEQTGNTSGAWVPYVKIARPDHWFKNVFMFPGVAVAVFGQPELLEDLSLIHI